MRRIVLSVLFLFGIVCGWHAMGERLVLIKEQMTEQSVKSEAKQYIYASAPYGGRLLGKFAGIV